MREQALCQCRRPPKRRVRVAGESAINGERVGLCIKRFIHDSRES